MINQNWILTILCVIAFFATIFFYRNWRKFKAKIYGHKKLEVSDWRLNTGFWFFYDFNSNLYFRFLIAGNQFNLIKSVNGI